MVSQEDYVAFNQYNAQLNALTTQKNQLKMIVENMKDTLEEDEKTQTEDIYKNLCHVMIKTTKEKIKKDLEGELETLTVRIKTVEKQEEIVTKKLGELKTKIEAEMKKASAVTPKPETKKKE
jgi:prefoldin beta subunit